MIDDIIIEGNKKTRESVITREILFSKGDTVEYANLSSLILQSRDNILKTSLFHFVTPAISTSGNKITVTFNVIERWYWWIWPLIENPDRNFNDWLKHRDLLRLSGGLFYQHDNARGRMEQLDIKALTGYERFLSGYYEWPYINKAKTLGFGLFASYSARHEINYATLNNRQLFYHGNKVMFQAANLAINLRYRPGFNISHFVTLQLSSLSIHDSINILNNDFLKSSDTDPELISLAYIIKADYRDNKNYPLAGSYAESELSMLSKPGTSYIQGGWRTSLRAYRPVANRLFAASEIVFRVSLPEIKPYYLQYALGFERDFVRGYEYLVVEAPHYFIFKSHLRYAVVPLHHLKMPFIKSEKFGVVPVSVYSGIHFDTGIAFPALNKQLNPLQNQMLAGYGAGIDLVTYYDKVFRFEYTFSREGHSGFFIHFIAMI